MSEYFSDFKCVGFVEPLAGIRVKSVCLDNVVMTYMEFEPNMVLPEHVHPHEQITMIHRGKLEMTVDGQTKTMETGDARYEQAEDKAFYHGYADLEEAQFRQDAVPVLNEGDAGQQGRKD